MDFVVTETPKCANGEFQFQALSDEAKQFTAARMGHGAVGFSLDRLHFSSAVKAILAANLTVYMK